jgi:hypothetical protein
MTTQFVNYLRVCGNTLDLKTSHTHNTSNETLCYRIPNCHFIKATDIIKIKQRKVTAFKAVCHFVFIGYVILFKMRLKQLTLLRLAATAVINSWRGEVKDIHCVIYLLPTKTWNYCCCAVNLTYIYYRHSVSFINNNCPFLVTTR